MHRPHPTGLLAKAAMPAAANGTRRGNLVCVALSKEPRGPSKGNHVNEGEDDRQAPQQHIDRHLVMLTESAVSAAKFAKPPCRDRGIGGMVAT